MARMSKLQLMNKILKLMEDSKIDCMEISAILLTCFKSSFVQLIESNKQLPLESHEAALRRTLDLAVESIMTMVEDGEE